MIIVLLRKDMTLSDLGYLPAFLCDDDLRTAREQFDDNYAHGGGWRPISGFTKDGNTLQYPGDPPLQPMAVIKFRREMIFIYPHSVVCVLQPDGSFEIARMD